MSRVNLFDIDIDVLTMDETVDKVEERIINHQSTHLLGINADKINGLSKGKHYEKIVKSAEIINADGASVVLASRFLKKSLPERVAGIDLMQRLLKLAEDEQYSVYFVGAKPDVINGMISNIQNDYPQLPISGYRDGYFSKGEWVEVSNEIRSKSPQIIFVGITSPKKEYLIDYFMERGINSIFMGVGGSFDVLSGKIKRAPLWMQRIYLEWLFRILQEPRRLFYRYFIGNIKFIYRVLREKSMIKERSKNNEKDSESDA